jgi:hypothetical protein
MAEKLASKELTLRLDGTLALAEGEFPVEFPHAAVMIAIAPTDVTAKRFLNLTKSVPSSCKSVSPNIVQPNN